MKKIDFQQVSLAVAGVVIGGICKLIFCVLFAAAGVVLVPAFLIYKGATGQEA